VHSDLAFLSSLELSDIDRVTTANLIFDVVDWGHLQPRSLTVGEVNDYFGNLAEKYSSNDDIGSQGVRSVLAESPRYSALSLASVTGKVYSDLWSSFDDVEYFDKTLELLQTRFTANAISIEKFSSCLDAGCGSGRYSVALKKMNPHMSVTGLDVSSDAINFGRQMAKRKGVEVSFQTGSVLDLPFEDESFDFVFSNGVLHHTSSTEQGLREINRILKPGGGCWLYLYGGKGALFWDIVECCRAILRDVPQEYTQNIMAEIGFEAGKIFHRCDFFYVPTNRRYLESEVTAMLENSKFSRWHRLERDVGHGWDEILWNHPNTSLLFGEGEMKFWVQK